MCVDWSDGHSEGVGLCCKVQEEMICDDPVTALDKRHQGTEHKGHREEDCARNGLMKVWRLY